MCTSRRRTRRGPRGFTLIELLVVIAIIALLVAILMPTLDRAKELARRTACLANLRTTALAAITYTADFGGHRPAMWDWRDWQVRDAGTHVAFNGSWRMILPHDWSDHSFVQPLRDYGLVGRSLICPTVANRRRPEVPQFDDQNPDTNPWLVTAISGRSAQNPPARYWKSHYSYVAGLPDGDEQGLMHFTNPPRPHTRTQVYGDPPTMARLRERDDPAASMVLLADRTIYNNQVHTSKLNHPRGGRGEAGSVTETFESFADRVAGGNRVHADGSGVWNTPDRMGKNYHYGIRETGGDGTLSHFNPLGDPHWVNMGRRAHFW